MTFISFLYRILEQNLTIKLTCLVASTSKLVGNVTIANLTNLVTLLIEITFSVEAQLVSARAFSFQIKYRPTKLID